RSLGLRKFDAKSLKHLARPRRSELAVSIAFILRRDETHFLHPGEHRRRASEFSENVGRAIIRGSEQLDQLDKGVVGRLQQRSTQLADLVLRALVPPDTDFKQAPKGLQPPPSFAEGCPPQMVLN